MEYCGSSTWRSRAWSLDANQHEHALDVHSAECAQLESGLNTFHGLTTLCLPHVCREVLNNLVIAVIVNNAIARAEEAMGSETCSNRLVHQKGSHHFRFFI